MMISSPFLIKKGTVVNHAFNALNCWYTVEMMPKVSKQENYDDDIVS